MPYNVALELRIPPSEFAIKTVEKDYLRNSSEVVSLTPRRVLPVLEFPDGSTMIESGAIVLYLLETFDKEGKLHPLPGAATRTKFLQAVVYVAAECYKASDRVFFLCFGIDKKARDQEKLKAACDAFRKVVTDHLLQEMGHHQKYYLGDDFSAADVVFSYPLRFAEYCDCGLIEDGPVKDYFVRLKERDAYNLLYNPEWQNKLCNPES